MIGLTGGIASGKSTVTKRLRELGAFVIDADEIAREVMDDERILRKIKRAFGKGVFREDGSLDRRSLAEAAFASEEKTIRLELITHPEILMRLAQMQGDAERSGKHPIVFLDAPLLIESNFEHACEKVWLVTADEETRIARAMARSGMTREEVVLRMERQMPDNVKARYASVIIENDGSEEELLAKVDRAFEDELLRLGTEASEAYGREE